MNENQPTLPKWPFYLGDILLVGIALLLAFREGGPLEAGQMFWVVSAVALGAGLFVLPYIIEYRTRLTDLQNSRDVEIWENTERMDRALDNLSRVFAEHKRDRETIERSLAFLEGLSRQLEQRVARMAVSPAPAAGASFADGGEPEESAESDANAEEELADAEDPADTAEFPESGELSDDGEVFDVPEADGADDGAELSESDDFSDELGEADLDDLDEDVEDVDADDDVELSDESKLDSDEDSDKADEPDDSVDEAEPSAVEEAEDGEQWEQQELLPVEERFPVRRKRRRVKGTVLIVDSLIGIGNKPYLRGEGGGLTWEKGLPMEFVEIGKWQWLAGETDEDIRCRVYRNDEVEADCGEIIIPAGQRVTISVNFPRS